MSEHSQPAKGARRDTTPVTDQLVLTPDEPEPHLPAPIVWPAIAASGIALFFWGFVSNLAVTVAGAVLFIVAAVGWAQRILVEAGGHGKDEGQGA